MFKEYRKNIKRKIERFCKTNYPLINKDNMKMGRGLFNNRCHLNAVQMVKTNKAEEVHMVVSMNSKEFPFVHFINTDKEGKFIDNTLGWKYETYDYYIIKKIEPEEYEAIEDVLLEAKKSLIEIHSNKFINKLIGLDEHNLGI